MSRIFDIPRPPADVCEMIFISAETFGIAVFFEALVNTTVWRSHE